MTISLTQEAQRLLHELALLKGLNRSSVAEVLIREESRRLGVEVKRIGEPDYHERDERER